MRQSLIRTLHFSDFLKLLGRLHQVEIGLNLPDNLIVAPSPLTAALTQQIPVNSLGSNVYIYQLDKQPMAFLQVRARNRREEWDVMALGTVGTAFAESIRERDENEELGEPDPDHNPDLVATARLEGTHPTNPLVLVDLEDAWLDLLNYMVRHAGEKGVFRIFAKLSVDSPELDLFNQLGFHAYTHENLFYLHHHQHIERPANFKLNLQRSKDHWHIQRLYEAVTPSQVQHAEHTNKDSWELPRNYTRSIKETAWAVYEGEHIAAYVRLVNHKHKYLLTIMNLDNWRVHLPDLVRFALANIKPEEDVTVYCSVRAYQSEQESVLEDAGFQFFGKQAVLVKHTVHYIRKTEKALNAVRDRRLELARSTANPTLVAQRDLPQDYIK
jgi:hypothetical protein